MSFFRTGRRLGIRLKKEEAIVFCFFAGLLGGTAAANLLYPSMSREAGYYLELLDGSFRLREEERLSLFWQILRQRLSQVGIAWLMGMTAYAFPIFCLASAALGLSAGLLLSVITVQKGIFGLPFFLMTLFPQILCYLPLGAILLLWVTDKQRRLSIPALFILALLAALGSACEAWLNPLFLGLVL